MLGARIAADGQWRMAPADSISPRLFRCMVAFEDERFYHHPGVDPLAVIRALRENAAAGGIVSGGSTLTMQVIRMARGNRPRSLWNKAVEAAMALRLSIDRSKSEVLHLWADHAPFGGNIVGVGAACYRYFGRAPADLSWAEAAVLSVLPNSPGLIRPGRQQELLRKKRDRLLLRLYEGGVLDTTELVLATAEPLPGRPQPLPDAAPHLLTRLGKTSSGRIRTDLSAPLQQQIGELLLRHHGRLAQNQIHNLAVLVSEVGTGRTVAYHGNVPGLAARHSPAVDLLTAPRSPGSLLKPLLYARAIDAGTILPGQWLEDAPTSFQNFRPANFNRSYDGVVPADEALTRSLNIPFVHLLRAYGSQRFLAELRGDGFATLDMPADHYGLTLILGGGEITASAYHRWMLGAAGQLLNYDARRQANEPTDFGGITAGATYTTFNQLRELTRPDELGAHRQFRSHRPVAWKTGTSFGFRDAWASGATPAFVVTVWAGNASGEGRPGLVGTQAAAPLLFDVLRVLEPYSAGSPVWFEAPYDDLRRLRVCAVTGYVATELCPADSIELPIKSHGSPCPHHRGVTVDTTGRYRVRIDCEPQATQRAYLTLPPRAAYFYRRRVPSFTPLPPWREDCRQYAPYDKPLQLIYPEGGGVLSAASDWLGGSYPFHFEAAHTDPAATIHWHLNEEYVGATRTFHVQSIDLLPGDHRLTLVDEQGHRLSRRLVVK